MHEFAQVLRKSHQVEKVLVVDVETMRCIPATVSNVTLSGCRLCSEDISKLSKNIGIRVADCTKLIRAQILSITPPYAFARLEGEREIDLVDNRTEQRTAVNMKMKITGPDGRISASGRVVNAGKNGCRIEADGLSALQGRVHLQLARFDKPMEAEIVWREGNTAGLRLIWAKAGDV